MDAFLNFMQRHGGDMYRYLFEHVWLTYYALVIAIAIALPLGIYLTRCPWKRFVGGVLGAVGVIQTVPSLALVAFVSYVFLIVQFTSIGRFPALVALVLYALLPILRNTYTGIRQVDPNVIEVARGMGMTNRQILMRVQLPLSLPVIMAGIRISTVWTIGVACLAVFIGGGGLGTLIMRGLRTMQPDLMLAGTIPAALLAIVLDWLLSRLEDWFTPGGIGGDETPGG
jgi:osmoprotectant transport system permease protein